MSDPKDRDIDDGLPPGRDCPTCGAPLEPEHLHGLALAWRCPRHGLVDFTPDALADG